MKNGFLQHDHDCDVAIVGAGPTGLYAAYYAGFRGLSVTIIDSLTEPGGQIAALYPTKLIYDVAGFPAIRGQELVDNLVDQTAPFKPRYLLGERAEDLTRNNDCIMLTTHVGTTIQAKAVIITGGIGTFTPRSLPQAGGFEGKGLVYFVRELDQLAGLDILIVGGGDSAFDWALNLEQTARSVTLIHRRDRFTAHEHSVALVRRSSVDIHTFTEVDRILGEENVQSVEIVNKRTGDRMHLAVDCIIAALGFTADIGPLKRWGLELNKRTIAADTRMATNLNRVFAAGDIANYPGKVKLISVGFGEAATAVNNAAVTIDPEAQLFPGHSSDKA